jgi:hypothetical protein
MNLTEISFNRLKTQIEIYLKQEYSKTSVSFDKSSPYGQILLVLENLFQLSMLYLKNSINQFDLSAVNSTNTRVIRNAAIFAGHNPTRNISATGSLKINLKTSTDIRTDIPGGRITLSNRQLLKNKTNGLFYSINLGSEKITYNLTNLTNFTIDIIQGEWQRRLFTGTGNENQTYQITVRGNSKEVENFNYEVLVNGEYWTVKKHIYELLPDEKACVIKSGFNRGIDIIFGNSGFGAKPSVGSTIEVNYLVSDGAVGSIFRRTINDWTFVEEALDGFGNTIDMADLFDISFFNDINFGADAESTSFTKNILPIVSNNFVIGLPQQFAYQIKKLGVFSHVNAYSESGTIFVAATPNIKLFKSENADYFAIDVKAFELDNYEKSKILKYLRTGGNILLTSKIEIVSPVLSFYIINVFIITYSDAQDNSVNSQIYNKISEYFLDFTKMDRVPRSDIISELSSIGDIHSVDVSFISKKNEDYHKAQIVADENRKNQFASKEALKLNRPNPNYNPKITPGLDPILGDIVFTASEIPVIRGGWYDRVNTYFSDNIDDKGLKSVNIIKKGTVDVSKKQKI